MTEGVRKAGFGRRARAGARVLRRTKAGRARVKLARSAEEPGDVDDLAGGFADADSALHPELSKRRVCGFLVDATMLHQDAFRAIDDLAIGEARLRIVQLGAQRLVRLE